MNKPHCGKNGDEWSHWRFGDFPHSHSAVAKIPPFPSPANGSFSPGLIALCFLLLVQSLTAAPSLNDVITARDVERLSQLLRKAALPDLETAHSVAAGLGLVAKGSGDVKTVSRVIDTYCWQRRERAIYWCVQMQSQVCQFLKKYPNPEALQDIFYATSTAASLGSSCDVSCSFSTY